MRDRDGNGTMGAAWCADNDKSKSKKIAILAGGFSPEREVSLSSAAQIARALIANGYRVAVADVYEGVELAPGERIEDLFTDAPPAARTVGENTVWDPGRLRAESGNGNALIGKDVLTLSRVADAVFVATHGGIGEDGRLQSVLDCAGVHYTGSHPLGCCLSMNKAVSKQLFVGAGIPTADWIAFSGEQAAELSADAPQLHESAERIAETVGIPCVVKPCECGSSVGVTIVRESSGHSTWEELEHAILAAAEYGAFLAERFIPGRELTVGVLNGRTLPAVEILPPDGGEYNYRNKYNGTTTELCPAPLPARIRRELNRLTLLGMETLHLTGYARFDYLLDGKGRLFCLEANALPGMTATSLFPRAALEADISYGALCEEILQTAF